MKTQTFLSFYILLIGFSIFAQEEEQPVLSLNDGTIENQFEYVSKKSGRYQEYKVIKTTWFNTLRSHVKDSLNKVKKDLQTTREVVSKQKEDYKALEKQLNQTKKDLEDTTHSKDTINFLGLKLKKALFKTIFWSILSLLTLGLLFFIYRFKNSNAVTIKTNLEYKELESEFKDSKTRALEREQVLNRKLQDEVNKHKKK